MKDEAGFKNFHRSLCARFGYTHDEEFWWRDLVSLEEHLAKGFQSPPSVNGLAELQSASERVLEAFNTMGRTNGIIETHRASLECERSMVALSDVMFRQTGYADKGEPL